MKFAVTTLVFCVGALLALGMVMLYSSSMVLEPRGTHVPVGARFLILQLAWGAMGLVVCVAAVSMNYRVLKKVAWPLLGLVVLLLGLVFVPHVGIKVNGARRWVGYGPAHFQPSELAKVALMIVVAWYGERYQRQMPTFKRGIFVPSVVIAVVLALVFVEPDRGATILMAGVAAVMLLVAGVRWRFILPPALAGLTGLVFSLMHDRMRSGRIAAWLDLDKYKSDAGYQAYQAMLALGSGGWTGLGLGNGRQKLGFVPEDHTDFILSIIGEELGVIATLLVVLAFIGIILCGVYISLRAPDTFGLLLGCGISFMIGFQALINIGVVTSALPNKGLPLPFISYGGSNLLMMLTSVGILLSIARQGRGQEEWATKTGPEEQVPSTRSRGNPFRTAESDRRPKSAVTAASRA